MNIGKKFIDLTELKIKPYEFTRILGILLDNSIEAAQECDKKYINIRHLREGLFGNLKITVF